MVLVSKELSWKTWDLKYTVAGYFYLLCVFLTASVHLSYDFKFSQNLP